MFSIFLEKTLASKLLILAPIFSTRMIGASMMPHSPFFDPAFFPKVSLWTLLPRRQTRVATAFSRNTPILVHWLPTPFPFLGPENVFSLVLLSANLLPLGRRFAQHHSSRESSFFPPGKPLLSGQLSILTASIPLGQPSQLTGLIRSSTSASSTPAS